MSRAASGLVFVMGACLAPASACSSSSASSSGCISAAGSYTLQVGSVESTEYPAANTNCAAAVGSMFSINVASDGTVTVAGAPQVTIAGMAVGPPTSCTQHAPSACETSLAITCDNGSERFTLNLGADGGIQSTSFVNYSNTTDACSWLLTGSK